MIENDIQFLFYPRFLFASANISFFIYQWFPDGLQPKWDEDFVISYFYNCQESEGKNNKAWLQENVFDFQIFETFENLKIHFSIILNQRFCIVINAFEVTLLHC